jgi:hypothetical protein
MANKQHAATEHQARMNGHQPDLDMDHDDEQVLIVDPQKLCDLLLEYPRIQRALTREEGIDNARHAFYDVLLAEVALKAGWQDTDIVGLIRQGNARSAREKPNIAYCKLAIHEARLKAKTGDLDFAREALLLELSDAWKLDIRAVIRHGIENSLWHLQLEDATEIQLGTTQDLMSQTKVRAKIFDATGHMIPRYTPKEADRWDYHLRLVAHTATTIDTPEMTRLGQAKSYVLGYLQSVKCDLDRNASSEELTGLLEKNKPCVHEGRLILSARQLLVHHVRLINPKLKEEELLDLLRLLKGKHKRINIFTPKKTSRSVWYVPVQSFAETTENEEFFATQVLDE